MVVTALSDNDILRVMNQFVALHETVLRSISARRTLR